MSVRDACESAAGTCGADGAWVSIMGGRGARELVYATGPVAAQLDELQFTLGEGPCGDAFGSGGPVLVPDLGAVEWGRRWPVFIPMAAAAGAAAVFAFPLVSGVIGVGVLALWRAAPAPLDAGRLADSLVFADMTLSLVLGSRAGSGENAAAWGADGWGTHRPEVYQATGMVSVQLGVSLEEALARLRAYAFAQGRLVGEVAADVAARRLRLAPDVDPEGLR